MRLPIGLCVLACCFAGAASAETTGVHEKKYGYGYGDTVKAVTDDAFVVCEGCKADSLSKLPKQIVAVRITDTLPPHDGSLWQVATNSDHGGVRGKDVLSEEGSKKSASVPRHPPILFSFDSDVLSADHKSRLDAIIGQVPAGGALEVDGYTCSVGNKSYNTGLSKRRADHVSDYLRKKGARVIRVEGKGECCPVSKDKKLNRRVEITEKEN